MDTSISLVPWMNKLYSFPGWKGCKMEGLFRRISWKYSKCRLVTFLDCQSQPVLTATSNQGRTIGDVNLQELKPHNTALDGVALNLCTASLSWPKPNVCHLNNLLWPIAYLTSLLLYCYICT